jgi:hypothetical protein
MGHRDLLVTQTYLRSKATTAPFIPREASAAGWLRSNALIAEVGPGTQVSDFATNRGLADFEISTSPQPVVTPLLLCWLQFEEGKITCQFHR